MVNCGNRRACYQARFAGYISDTCLYILYGRDQIIFAYEVVWKRREKTLLEGRLDGWSAGYANFFDAH